jgi:hypothetical protein
MLPGCHESGSIFAGSKSVVNAIGHIISCILADSAQWYSSDCSVPRPDFLDGKRTFAYTAKGQYKCRIPHGLWSRLSVHTSMKHAHKEMCMYRMLPYPLYLQQNSWCVMAGTLTQPRRRRHFFHSGWRTLTSPLLVSALR